MKIRRMAVVGHLYVLLGFEEDFVEVGAMEGA